MPKKNKTTCSSTSHKAVRVKRSPVSRLAAYTDKLKAAYDPAFDKDIRARQPGWFGAESKAAKKAWKTRRANEEAAKWTLAGKKAWATRRANARKRSNAAKKAWRTIRANAK